MKSVLGIDLGTTKSVVGVWDGEKPCILPSQFGGKSMPSLVMVTPEEEIYAGFQAARHPDRYNSKNITISSVKRMMGSKGETGWGWWRSYPQEVSSFIISELRQQAEQVLGSEVNQAVIAIPSHFDEAQRRATKEAATIAGIEVLRLLNEATAAILAYGNTRKNDGTVVVFDLGGGTLDVSVADLGGGVVNVKTIEGDSHLGGDDFTQAIIDHATETIRKDNGTETANIAAKSLMLREEAERAKIGLSSGYEATMYIPGFLSCGTKHRDLRIEISRPTFESLCKPLLDRAIELLRKALQNSGITRPGALLLLGGSSRIPILRQRVKEELGVEPFTGVDPETCVAQGAIIQAGILTGAAKHLLLLDVMPSSYGIGMQGGKFNAIIKKNETIPTKHSETFTTTADNQRTIGIDLFNGDSTICDENTYVGHIDLDGIPSAPKGVPQIEVTFNADANMIVHTIARDLGTGKEKEFTIRSPFGLSQVQINLMAKRLKKWREKRFILDACAKATMVQTQINQLLTQSRKLLENEEIETLDNCALKLAKAIQNCVEVDSLTTVISITGEDVERITVHLQKRRASLLERQELTKRIDLLEKMSLEPYSTEQDTLRHGICLLADYDARGATTSEIATLVKSVRWSYCDLIAKQIKTFLQNLYQSEEFKECLQSPVIVSAKTSAHSSAPTIAYMELQPARIIRSMLTEDYAYADDICGQVEKSVALHSALATVWFLVYWACGWREHRSYPVNLPGDANLANFYLSTLLHILNAETSGSRRKIIVETLIKVLPIEGKYDFVVKAVLDESDEAIQNCLLDYVDKQPNAALTKWFLASDAKARERTQNSAPILQRMCDSQDDMCREFAVSALVALNSPPGWCALEGLVNQLDEKLRISTYRALFTTVNSKQRIAIATRKAFSDACPAIRLLGLNYVESDPTTIEADVVLELVQTDPTIEVRCKAISLLAHQYGETGQLRLLSVALTEARQSVRKLALIGVKDVRAFMDRDMTKILDLACKLIEGQKTLNMMDRRICRSILRRKPSTGPVIDLLITQVK
jgi:molecular chaperone DnaK